MKKTLVIVLLFVILIGCSKPEEANIVAQVNDDTLTMEELKSPFSDEQWSIKTKAEINNLVQNWIDLTVLAQAADQRDISSREEIKFRIENSTKSIKGNALIAQEFTNIVVAENDLFDYYKLHQNRYKTTYPEYKVQRIYTEDIETTNTVLDELKNGMKFTEAAKQYSKEASGANGGYIGFVGEKDLEAELWTRIQGLKKWHYDKVNSSLGFYVIRQYESRNVEVDIKFIEVKNQIRNLVLEEKQQKIYRQFVDKMRKQTEIIKISI